MYVAIAIVAIGEAISFTFNSDSSYEPVYWLIIYLLSLALLIFGDQSVFLWTTTLGIISMVLVVLYLVASSNTMDFHHFIIEEEYNRKVFIDMKTFVSLLPISSWFFVGIDTLPLACSDTKMVLFFLISSIIVTHFTIGKTNSPVRHVPLYVCSLPV